MADTLNQYQSNLTAEQVDQALHKIRQVDDSIAQAQSYAEQAGQYADSINPAGFAPKSHADSGTQYGTATDGLYGHVRLSDAPGESGVSDGVAVTPAALQAVAAVANAALPISVFHPDAGVNIDEEPIGVRVYNGYDLTQQNRPFDGSWGLLFTVETNPDGTKVQIAVDLSGKAVGRVKEVGKGWTAWGVR